MIINIAHTSNSFSSNMASRFSGTSSFKPASDQGVCFNVWGNSTVRRGFLTFQEVLHFIPHLGGQSVLCQQVEVMHLVFIGNADLGAARYQLHHLQDSTWPRNEDGEAVKKLCTLQLLGIMSALMCTCQDQMKHREHQHNFRQMTEEEAFIICPVVPERRKTLLCHRYGITSVIFRIRLACANVFESMVNIVLSCDKSEAKG